MDKTIFVAEVTPWINDLSCLLHQGNSWRLAPLLWGMLFARGRRTVACWLRTGELGDDYQGYYYFLGSLGRNVKSVAGALLRLAVGVICPGERLLFAIDDTPTKRYGKHVEGAGSTWLRPIELTSSARTGAWEMNDRVTVVGGKKSPAPRVGASSWSKGGETLGLAAASGAGGSWLRRWHNRDRLRFTRLPELAGQG